MNITEGASFDKERFPLFRRLYLALVIILIALLSFGIGRLTVVGKSEPMSLEYDPSLAQESLIPKPQTASVINTLGQGVIASKNGSKYHYPHCSGAKQIKEENKITFASPSAAEASGYTLAANCKAK